MDAKRPEFGELKTKWILAKSPVKEEGTSGGGSSSVGREERSAKRSVKTAPISVPKWDGKTRSFPRFKKLWTENIFPFHTNKYKFLSWHDLKTFLCKAIILRY